MTMKNQDFEMFAGETKIINLTINNKDGSPVDLTESSIMWIIKTGKNSSIIKRSETNDVAIVDAVQGKCSIKLNPIDTANLCGFFRHKANMIDFVGNVSTVLTGSVNILQ